MLIYFITLILSYSNPLPVVVLHGILSDTTELYPVQNWLEQNTNNKVYNLEIGNGKLDSFFKPMMWQLNTLCDTIYNIQELENGFNFIGLSQGGLLARGYVEWCNKYPVFNLMTWGTPHSGVYYLDTDFSNVYTPYNQEHLSYSGYWKDTMRYSTYLSSASFLPIMNNEKNVNTSIKTNIESLKNFVMVWSKVDGVIEPVESCTFGYYKINTYELENLFESRQYTENLIGLKTLQEKNKLHMFEVDCIHTNFKTKRCLDSMRNITLQYV